MVITRSKRSSQLIIMGHQQSAVQFAFQIQHHVQHILRILRSVFPVGSSANKHFGSLTKARAIAASPSPPESSLTVQYPPSTFLTHPPSPSSLPPTHHLPLTTQEVVVAGSRGEGNQPTNPNPIHFYALSAVSVLTELM